MKRTCAYCKLEKDISCFGTQYTPRKKYKSYCIPCDNLYKKERYVSRLKKQDLSDLPGEVWLPIKGYEKMYVVSNMGRVKAIPKISLSGKRLVERLITPKKVQSGYFSVTLTYGSRVTVGVQRLVAFAFLPNPANKPETNHKNGIKADNRAENLEWCTRAENIQHAFDTGLRSGYTGASHPRAKLTEKEVLEIRERATYDGVVFKNLALQYGVTPGNIFQILTRRSWRHI